MRPTTVDAVIIGRGSILLVKRRFDPYKGLWAIPGGFVEEGETAEQAAARETFEETGVRIKVTKLLGVYSDPKRDPRGTVSVAFIAKALSNEAKGGDDAEEAKWFKLSEIPPLAFDHAKMINDARRML
ncbi:MAG: NUDIX hydrolase [Candidatus Micrarchaeota archaeon]|nr:NUDIX hydrolase [Candidatus Micrarchaeota archaeon]